MSVELLPGKLDAPGEAGELNNKLMKKFNRNNFLINHNLPLLCILNISAFVFI